MGQDPGNFPSSLTPSLALSCPLDIFLGHNLHRDQDSSTPFCRLCPGLKICCPVFEGSQQGHWPGYSVESLSEG